LQRTPRQEIKQRPGKGGKTFNYVEHGWVTERLNAVFQFAWDFEVLEEYKYDDVSNGAGEVGVKARLTVTFPNGRVIGKTQFGQADIKRDRNGVALSIIDDYKAAASDALKKCASLLGIGLDVYGRDNYGDEAHRTEVARSQAPIPISEGRKSAAQKKAATPWDGFMEVAPPVLLKLGIPEKMVEQFTSLIKSDLTVNGDIDKRDAVSAMYKTIKGWKSKEEALAFFQELVSQYSGAS
jgi:hypothetical protein